MTWEIGDLAVVREGERWTLVRVLTTGEEQMTVREVLDHWVFGGFGTVRVQDLEVPTEEELAVYLAQEIAR
jgi:hypothetical protein